MSEIQGKSRYPGNAAALIHSLAWVRGRQYSIPWKTTGREETEKNVPHRKVIGSMIRLLKIARL